MLQRNHLQVNSDLKNLSRILDWLNQIDHVSLSELQWLRCQIALAEGFTNAVRHAHQDLPADTPIDIEIKIAPDYVEMYIWDQGPPFDLAQKLASLPPYADQESERGRGILIMNQVADQLSYQRFEGVKNYLLMVKYVAGQD
ncbi:MAG: anti-sigma regulatory factor [Thermosynechococcaceae cyanobacterium]